MRLKRIVLDGYRHVTLHGHQHLDWRPEASYQMILGTNGSGKSSLMAECSPLPPTPSDYLKPGRKMVEYVHEDIDYVMTSEISTSTVRHSFIRDNVELNDGGTGQVQKELILRYFRYTEELHDLLTGRVKFSKMSTAERRKWITRLSQVDYTFALRLYDWLRSEFVTMKGFLKLTKQRLAEESQALSTMEEGQGIELRVKTLQSELQALLMARYPIEESSHRRLATLQTQQQAVEHAGESFVNSLKKLDFKRNPRDVPFMEERVQSLQADVRLHSSILERLQKEFSEVDNQLVPLRQEVLSTPEEMASKLDALRGQAVRIAQSVTTWPMLLSSDDAEATLRASEAAIPMALQLFSSLPNNKDRRYSNAQRDYHVARRREAMDKLAHSEGGQRLVLQRLHAIEHAKQETCPECRFTFTPGLHPAELPELNQKLQAFVANIAECQAAYNESDTYLSELEEYMAIYRQWRALVQQYPRLSPLWTLIQDRQIDLNDPGSCPEHLSTWHSEAVQAASYAALMHDVEKLTKLIEITTMGEGAALQQRLATLEQEITQHTGVLRALREALANDELHLTVMRCAMKLHDDFTQQIASLDDAFQLSLEAFGAEAIERDIQRAQTQLGALQHTLRTKEIAQGVIEDLQKSVTKATLDYEALLILTEELSPKEGLIAEQLLGFIQCLTAQINTILASVWTYELEVHPCKMGEGELDYLFPLQSGPIGTPAKDIKYGSTSQADMVDFAFAQTASLYLDLNDYPLFVDELGASFDEAHRPLINQFISRLMESNRYSQVFMISHYVAGWGSFTDAEYLVLDSRNITVPSVNNNHVVLS
jgi:ABC-type cobalamin/Fe3+-siderophores transport system ATPase subunit